MRELQPKDIKIVEGLPPKDNYDVFALDTEFFGMEKERLHRPHGNFACLTGTPDGKTVYIITDPALMPEYFERISGSLHIWHNAQFDIKQIRRWIDYPDRKNIWDTMLIEQIMYSGLYSGKTNDDDTAVRGSFALKDLYRRYCHTYLRKDERKSFSLCGRFK